MKKSKEKKPEDAYGIKKENKKIKKERKKRKEKKRRKRWTEEEREMRYSNKIIKISLPVILLSKKTENFNLDIIIIKNT